MFFKNFLESDEDLKDISKTKLADEIANQQILRIVYGLLDTLDRTDRQERDSRLMVSFRHFQDLMNMLTCNSSNNANLEGRGNFSRNSNLEGHGNFSRNNNGNLEDLENFSRNSNQLEGRDIISRNSNLGGRGKNNLNGRCSFSNNNREARGSLSRNLNSRDSFRRNNNLDSSENISTINNNLDDCGSYSDNNTNLEGRGYSPAYSRRPRISTPSSENGSSVSKIALPAKSTPYGSPRLSSPRIPIRNRGQTLTSPDSSISRSLHCSPVRNFESSGLFQHFYTNPAKHQRSLSTCFNQKPINSVVSEQQQQKPILKRANYYSRGGLKNNGSISLIPYKSDSVRGYVQHNNPKNNNNFDNEFSKYKPLPAINGVEKRSGSGSRMLFQDGGDVGRVKKLRRQLTYKVLKPVFVKGPSDMKAGKCGVNEKPAQDRRQAKKLRNKTVVITSSDLKKVNNNLEGSDRKVESLRDRLSVRKDLIEAGEKLKKGLSANGNAFWFEI
ncbi:hypothetical protein LSTR_LSTR012576 [Laodelphax striatellus]|uniref:Uncharacterized protein n=1 Tax=Laodelphax striatellus TaxID=195883 RepID=A0A482WUA7_LAOST|nr:hypothetical protein LSTR_LSTR012576 [Laodelphax striatellus]